MQGVSINLFVKTDKKKNDELGKVFHFDLFGKRELKYNFLFENSIKSVLYKELPNIPPNYFLVSKDFDLQEIYEKGIRLQELFTLNNVGIVTARDNFTIHTNKVELQKTIEEFLTLDDETARVRFNLGKDVRDWQVNFAKKDLQKNYPNNGSIVNINYRPFDIRWTFYTGNSKGFHCYPRTEIMKHFIRGNVGIVYKLGNSEEKSASAMVTNSIIDFRSWSRPGMQGGDYVSPLYIYPETNGQQTIDQATQRTPNLNPEIVKQIAEKLSLTFTPEKEQNEETFAPIDILDYIYAVLHSPTYRERYKEFLKIDFPRVPYPDNKEKFWQLVKLGGELRTIHLLENPIVEQYITSYPIDGTNIVDKPQYIDGKVYINKEQYFDKVPETAWNFYIGGYQPAQKWLKDRKGRELSVDDILHYQKIIVALSETYRIMMIIKDWDL